MFNGWSGGAEGKPSTPKQTPIFLRKPMVIGDLKNGFPQGKALRKDVQKATKIHRICGTVPIVGDAIMKSTLVTPRLLLPLLWGGLLIVSGPAEAALLNVQILGHAGNAKGGPDEAPPTYRGTGAVGGQEDFWNGIQAESFNQPLQISPPARYLASDGATPLPVRIKFKGFTAADHWPIADGAPVNHALMNSYLVAGSGATVTIEGLRPGKPYDLWLFGNNSRAGAGAKFSVNGNPPQSTQGQVGTAFTRGTDYVEFKNLAADDAGRLKIVLDAANPAIFAGAILNGLQLRGEFPASENTSASEGDPNRWALKCWLKAEDLAAAGSRPGDAVRVWQDAAWGLRFMPDSNPPRADSAPVYTEVSVPGTTNLVSVVQFNGESGLSRSIRSKHGTRRSPPTSSFGRRIRRVGKNWWPGVTGYFAPTMGMFPPPSCPAATTPPTVKMASAWGRRIGCPWPSPGTKANTTAIAVSGGKLRRSSCSPAALAPRTTKA